MIFLKNMSYQRRLKLNIKLGYLYNFLSLLLFNVVVWYLYETQFMSISKLFILYGIARLMVVLLEIPTGAFADLIGRKNTLALGIFLFATGWFVIPLFASVWSIIAGYLISNAGEALMSGAQEALTFDSLKEIREENRFAKVQSGYSIVSNIALVIGMVGGGFLYQINQGLPYYLTGIMGLLGTIVVLFCIEPNIEVEKFSWSIYLKQTKLGIKTLLQTPEKKQFSYLYMIIAAITFIYVYALRVAYVSTLEISSQTMGILHASLQILAAFLVYLFVKKMVENEKKFWYFMLLIPIIGYIFSAFLKFPIVYIFLLLVQFSSSLRFSGLSHFANQKIASNIRATGLSTLNMGSSLIFTLLLTISGFISKLWGVNMTMLFMGVITLIATLPVFVSYSKKI